VRFAAWVGSVYLSRMPEQQAAALAANPVLVRFRKALDAVYADRVERVVVHGSRERGDAYPESDYGVAVFLHDMDDRIAELYRLADLTSAILYDTGEFIHAMAYRAGSHEERTPVMREVRLVGVDL
jgi:predicted nucleotidyltransferase